MSFLHRVKRAAVILAVTLSLPTHSTCHAADIAKSQAGWAEVEITPPLGIGFGGLGGPETVAKKILDPLSSWSAAAPCRFIITLPTCLLTQAFMHNYRLVLK